MLPFRREPRSCLVPSPKSRVRPAADSPLIVTMKLAGAPTLTSIGGVILTLAESVTTVAPGVETGVGALIDPAFAFPQVLDAAGRRHVGERQAESAVVTRGQRCGVTED